MQLSQALKSAFHNEPKIGAYFSEVLTQQLF